MKSTAHPTRRRNWPVLFVALVAVFSAAMLSTDGAPDLDPQVWQALVASVDADLLQPLLGEIR